MTVELVAADAETERAAALLDVCTRSLERELASSRPTITVRSRGALSVTADLALCVETDSLSAAIADASHSLRLAAAAVGASFPAYEDAADARVWITERSVRAVIDGG